MEVNFFSIFNEMLTDYNTMIMTMTKSDDGIISISVMSKMRDKDNQPDIAPIVLRGTAEELNKGFLEAIQKPIERVNGLYVDIDASEKSVDEANKERAKKNKNSTRSANSLIKGLKKYPEHQNFNPKETMVKIIGDLPLKRDDVKKAVLKYLKDNKLRDEKDKMIIHTHEDLKPIIGETEKTVSLGTLLQSMMEHLSPINATEAKKIRTEKGAVEIPKTEIPKKEAKVEKEDTDKKLLEDLEAFKKLGDEKKYDEALAGLKEYSKTNKDSRVFHLIMTLTNARSSALAPKLELDVVEEKPIEEKATMKEIIAANPEQIILATIPKIKESPIVEPDAKSE